MNALTSSESTSAASAPTKRARPSVSPRGSPFPLSQSQCHLIDRNQSKKVSTVMYAKLFPQVPERANPWQRQALHCVSRSPLTLLLLLPRRARSCPSVFRSSSVLRASPSVGERSHVRLKKNKENALSRLGGGQEQVASLARRTRPFRPCIRRTASRRAKCRWLSHQRYTR